MHFINCTHSFRYRLKNLTNAYYKSSLSSWLLLRYCAIRVLQPSSALHALWAIMCDKFMLNQSLFGGLFHQPQQQTFISASKTSPFMIMILYSIDDNNASIAWRNPWKRIKEGTTKYTMPFILNANSWVQMRGNPIFIYLRVVVRLL